MFIVLYKYKDFTSFVKVKDFLAYLRFIVNDNDLEAFRRVANFPPRGNLSFYFFCCYQITVFLYPSSY